MAKSMVGVIPINVREQLVDAKTIGAQLGFTADYITRMAKAGKIPWLGIRNGARVYRRFNLAAVKAVLTHDVEEPETPKPVQQVGRRAAKLG